MNNSSYSGSRAWFGTAIRVFAGRLVCIGALSLLAGAGWSQTGKAATAGTIGEDTGERLYKSGRYLEAAARYRELLQRTPGNADLLLRLADCHYRLGQFAAAGMNFERALAAAPKSPAKSQAALLGMGKSMVAIGRSRDAIPYLTRARELGPDDRETQRMLALALHEANRVEEAEALLEALVKSDPADGESWYLLGSLRYFHGYFATALEAFEKSLAAPAQGGNRKARIYRSICLAQVGRAQEAEREIVKLLSDPEAAKHPDLLTAYAQLLYESGRFDEALKRADEAIAGAPAVSRGHFLRARILYRMNRLDEAAHEGEYAVRLSPQFPFARNLLMKIYKIQGRTEDAVRQEDWLREYENKKTQGRQ